FTALRDLETEGAMYADVHIKRAITNGEIPGPRIFASTRAMAPTGMYPIVSTNWELELPHGVEPVDGVDGARRAVREQVAHGADWIKYYSDRRYYFTPDSVLHSWVNFTDDEAKAIVNEAHRLGRKVAAHAIGSDGIAAALRAGVNTIEHGDGMTDSLADLLAARGVYWVPTVTVSRYVAGPRGGPWGPMVEHQRQAMARALKKGVKIVLGTDVGGFPWTELNQAKEFEYYVQYGMSPLQAIKLGAALKQLGATKRVLVIGAHPDDENSDFLAYLSRGMGAQAAYLSLSRGEGGQNLIGPELGPELGVIRTEELLAARREDGAHQFFTRAYDFGFSKTAEETLRFWPRDSLLADVLEVIRRFRPQIILSIFSGTARDGHGQHQVAGMVARQAFETLRDSSWGPVKLYRSSSFDTAGTTTTVDVGVLDPVVGRSYHQIAMAG